LKKQRVTQWQWNVRRREHLKPYDQTAYSEKKNAAINGHRKKPHPTQIKIVVKQDQATGFVQKPRPMRRERGRSMGKKGMLGGTSFEEILMTGKSWGEGR